MRYVVLRMHGRCADVFRALADKQPVAPGAVSCCNGLCKVVLAFAAIVCLVVVPAFAEEADDPRGVVVDEVRNEHPTFMVRVDVDKAERVYRGGEEMAVKVVSAKAGYLYLLYCDAGGMVTCLFPNAFGEDNRIKAMEPVVIPQPPEADKSSFRLRIGPPYGQEVLKAIVSLEPMDNGALGRLILAEGAQARLAGVRAVYVEEAKDTGDWAEHHVKIVTQEPGQEPGQDAAGGGGAASAVADGGGGAGPMLEREPESGPARRVGVFIGVSEYTDERIRDLTVCHRDASEMAKVLREHGQIGQGWVLLDKDATRANIEQTIRSRVASSTRPGDSVIIYWSGHGSRCADDGGDEKDGFDEFLVPYDGNLDSVATIRKTMIMDDTFGRWIQELDGRRVVLVLDTCHSGGQSSGQKAIAQASAAPAPIEFDFLDGELARIKDIGQRDTALLASSTSSQVSFERKEGDLSTMTYFLVQQLQSADGPVTVTEAYSRLKPAVIDYVTKTFPGTTQTPVLVNNLSGPFHLRP
jgi:hypothetical protein